MKAISKKEAAKRFGVAPSMVTKYIGMGMPVTSTGKVNWAAAQKWHKARIEPSLSGSFAARQRRLSEAEPARKSSQRIRRVVEENTTTADQYRRVFDEILSKRHLVPGIMRNIGVSDPVLINCIDDVFACLVCELSGGLDDVAYDWDFDDIPLVPDNDLEATAEVRTAGDVMADAAYLAIAQAIKEAAE